MTAAWFRPRRYGFGARPVTWQGWLLVIANIVVVLGATWIFMATNHPISASDVAVWFGLVFGTTGVVVWISYRTTDGAWRWRWGGRDDNQNGTRT